MTNVRIATSRLAGSLGVSTRNVLDRKLIFVHFFFGSVPVYYDSDYMAAPEFSPLDCHPRADYSGSDKALEYSNSPEEDLVTYGHKHRSVYILKEPCF